MKKKHVYIAIVVVVCFGVAAAIATYTAYTSDDIPYSPVFGSPRYDYTSSASIDFHDMTSTKYNDITGDYRPVYDALSDEEYEWIFGDLPKFKQDFFDIVNLIYDGKITDYTRVKEEYWKQPEFYVGWFGAYQRNYPDNDPNMYAVEGYGFFPLIKEVTANKGETFDVSCYFKTNFGIETYQGLIIKPYFPDSGKDMLGNVIFEQPSNAASYLKPKITNPDDSLFDEVKDNLRYTNVDESDWMVVLNPTYTVIRDKYGVMERYKGFYDDWVRLLSLEVEVSDSVPSGDYVIALKVVPPCFEINQEYYYSGEHEYYGMYYYPVSQLARSNIPNFQLIIHIE